MTTIEILNCLLLAWCRYQRNLSNIRPLFTFYKVCAMHRNYERFGFENQVVQDQLIPISCHRRFISVTCRVETTSTFMGCGVSSSIPGMKDMVFIKDTNIFLLAVYSALGLATFLCNHQLSIFHITTSFLLHLTRCVLHLDFTWSVVS